MGNFRLFLAAASIIAINFAFSVAHADEGIPSREVTIGLNDVYVPGGFDSSTDAYVIASGIFPNSCYKWRGAEVTTTDTYHHNVISKATVSQGMCLMVLIPFSKDVRIGKLPTGTHTLRFLNGDGTYFEKALNIE